MFSDREATAIVESLESLHVIAKGLRSLASEFSSEPGDADPGFLAGMKVLGQSIERAGDKIKEGLEALAVEISNKAM